MNRLFKSISPRCVVAFLLLGLAMGSQVLSGSERLEVTLLNSGASSLHWTLEQTIPSSVLSGSVPINSFPRPLIELLVQTGPSHGHVALTSGRWQSLAWGAPCPEPAPPGAELYGFWSKAPSRGDDDNELWNAYATSMAAVLGASLHELAKPIHGGPVAGTIPDARWGGVIEGEMKRETWSGQSRYTVGPREASCTENLTPWLKLLPCAGQAGLVSLVQAPWAVSGLYHSIALDFHPSPSGDGTTVRASFVLVTASHNPFGWLSGNGPELSCPVTADNSRVVLKVVEGALAPGVAAGLNGVQVLVQEYEGSADSGSNDSETNVDVADGLDGLRVGRRVIGTSLAGGVLETSLSLDDSADAPLTVRVGEIIPWFVRPSFHAWTTVPDDRASITASMNVSRLVPGRDRDRPCELEWSVTIAPGEEIRSQIPFRKVWMGFEEFPPDAHRAFDLPAPLVQVVETGRFHYAPTVAVQMPSPDFSMPYNTITINCTVLALCFGSLYNVLSRPVSGALLAGLNLKKRPVAKEKTS